MKTTTLAKLLCLFLIALVNNPVFSETSKELKNSLSLKHQVIQSFEEWHTEAKENYYMKEIFGQKLLSISGLEGKNVEQQEAVLKTLFTEIKSAQTKWENANHGEMADYLDMIFEKEEDKLTKKEQQNYADFERFEELIHTDILQLARIAVKKAQITAYSLEIEQLQRVEKEVIEKNRTLDEKIKQNRARLEQIVRQLTSEVSTSGLSTSAKTPEMKNGEKEKTKMSANRIAGHFCSFG